MEEVMKKKALFMVLIALAFVIGCNNKEQIDIDKIADQVIENLNLPFETGENLNFINEILIDNKNIEITWISSDENIITNQGVITRDFVDQETDLKIVISYLDLTTQRPMGKMKVLAYPEEDIINIIRNTIYIPIEVSEDINLIKTLNIHGKEFSLTWTSSNQQVISNSGEVFPKTFIQQVNLSLIAKYQTVEYTVDFGEISVLPISAEALVNQVIESVIIPSSTKTDINLPTNINGVKIDWFTSDSTVLSDKGKWFYHEVDKMITLTAVFVYGSIFIDVDYQITVLTYNDFERLNMVVETIHIPTYVSGNLDLKTNYPYSVTASWSSSDQLIITNQ